MFEFRVNEHLLLRLEDGKTVIYVNNERFRQCKFLLLNIDVDEIRGLDKIQSIDMASEILDKSLETSQEGSINPIEIPPEVEFWGHCSNLQVWVENQYDTRLLHSNLAFPLLKRLTETGDILAKVAFKEEIVKRFSSGERSVMQFLMIERYLDILDEEEFETFFYSVPHLFKEFFLILSREDEEFKEDYDYNLYHFIKILIEKESLLEEVILDLQPNLIRCLIMIAALTPVDGETIELILKLFKKLMNSSEEVQEIVKKEISYQFHNCSSDILLELMYDDFYRILDPFSLKTLLISEIFIENLLFLIDNNLRRIIDNLIEFFKLVYDDIDEKFIRDLLKLISNDTKARFKEQLEVRLEEYSTRKNVYWENKEDLIQMANVLLEYILI